MSRVEEIERAIEALPPEEFNRVLQRVYELEHERWEAQIDRDASSGKLDFLIEEAREDIRSGRLREWPEPE
jgi:hypothetical protein